MTTIKKWQRTIAVCLVQLTAYKLNFVLLVIAPAVVFFLIKYNLWASLYRFQAGAELQGYSLAAMLEYQALVLIVGTMSQSYTNIKLSEDIRLGRITAFLLYPFSFFQFHAGNFIALSLVYSLTAMLLLLATGLFGWLPTVTLASLISGLLLAFLGSLLWFIVRFTIGILAFWLEETWVLRVIFLIISGFLSGAIMPLEFFPPAFSAMLHFLPFPYLTFVPVRHCMGASDTPAWFACLVCSFWIAAFGLIAAFVWRRGLRLYSAAGI